MKKFNNENDEVYGDICEKLFIEAYGKDWIKLPGKHLEADFKHKKQRVFGELKSRKYEHNRCPDWMVGKNKIDLADKLYKKKVGFVIYNMFYDGLWKWVYSPEKVKTDCNIREGGRLDRGKNELKPDYYYIKKECMIKCKKNVCAPRIKDPFAELMIE
tara:strand:+ start:429 stop:902 length:474 start_codon:yes stop_codon:yes gene_type:complete